MEEEPGSDSEDDDSEGVLAWPVECREGELKS